MSRKVIIPDEADGPRRLVFYLALEEWLSARGEDAFFVWNTRPTVIYGRNQDPYAEINLEFCNSHGIECYRRKSGGGCVYSDSGNLMTSRTVPGGNVGKVFSEHLNCIARGLESLGIQAVLTEHNDVLVDGRKVSGNAFFRSPTGNIVHGTLLYDSDFATMAQALNPPEAKLARHGVQSVRQRVANLREFTTASRQEVRKAIERELENESGCPEAAPLVLSPAQIEEICSIEAGYLAPEFRGI